ncbi:MAG: sugar ABC transporter substrate-binding protein [Cytophagaceae bacterium]|nr:MAG: sugar ABC transporter substrate-binding protein [Cytophagaceae bacterium]
MRTRALFLITALTLTPPVIAQDRPTNSSTPVQDGYLLGVNDEVEVTIFGSGQNQTVRTRIKEDGTIILPFIGTINARDRTARQLADDVSVKLKVGGYFTKPTVNVDVTQYISNSITVFGQVGTPGLYPLDRAQTVAMVLARAGGSRGEAADYVIVRRRGDVVEHRVAFDVLTGEWSTETPLVPGDTLYVPLAPVIYISGQVAAPGSFTIKSGMTLRQVLARAGGTTLAGSRRNISIFRDGTEVKRAKLDEAVQPNDSIFVHERFL